MVDRLSAEELGDVCAKLRDIADRLGGLDSASGDARAFRLVAQFLEQQRGDIASLEAENERLRRALGESADHFARIKEKALHWQRTFSRNDDAVSRWGEIGRWAHHRAECARAGLVKGITPTSIRGASDQPIRVLAFDTPAGADVGSPGAGCSSSSASRPLSKKGEKA